mmetsp:Transcript_42949/g.100974  ORF Transcript_42949/g.100974 Transcript_42949/m.100974 type:complete len:205 (-) Transcript_42949:278-892(-)
METRERFCGSTEPSMAIADTLPRSSVVVSASRFWCRGQRSAEGNASLSSLPSVWEGDGDDGVAAVLAWSAVAAGASLVSLLMSAAVLASSMSSKLMVHVMPSLFWHGLLFFAAAVKHSLRFASASLCLPSALTLLAMPDTSFTPASSSASVGASDSEAGGTDDETLVGADCDDGSAEMDDATEESLAEEEAWDELVASESFCSS